MSFIKNPLFRGLISFYKLSIKGEKFGIFVFLLLTVFSVIITLITPYFFKTLIISLDEKNYHMISHYIYLILYLIFWNLGKLNLFIREIFIAKSLELWKKSLSENYFKGIFSKFSKDFIKPEVGEIVATIEKIQNEIPHFILTILLLLVPTIIEIVAISAILSFQFGFHLGIISISLFLLIIYTNIVLSQRLTDYQRKAKHAKKSIYNFSNDRFSNIQTIFNYGMQNKEYENFFDKLNISSVLEIKNRKLGAFSSILQIIFVSIIFIYITLWSYYKVSENIINIYDFILINSFVISIINPINAFALVFRNVRRSVEDMKDVWETKNEAFFLLSNKISHTYYDKAPDIILNNVTFGYNKSSDTIKRVNLTFKSNSTTAIVGYSGSGKSTICKLINHLNPRSGKVLIGNIDRSSTHIEALSKLFGIVEQSHGLFNDTLLYNMTYGVEKYKKEDLYDVIENLELRELISNLPNGIYSDLETFGANLSDGQKQKILIARVIMNAPKIVILDEATSNMDFKTEEKIYNYLFKKLSTSTIIVVSHRLSSIVKLCERVVVISEGKINEIGNHDKLLSQNIIYKSLWKKND